ncbi:MAG TPA: type VI secretion system tip protein TssI/VgrG [Polyangium sp.]|nr:type VI secretion system tip protein TssI/VgrG [Polyangium sp.]
MARIDLWIQGVDAPLFVRSIRVREVMSCPFEVSIVARSHAADLDLDAAGWAPASVSLVSGWSLVLGGGARAWSGLVQRIEQTAVELSGLSTYEIRIVPRLSLLTQNRDYRVFQRQTVPAIAKRLLEDWFVDHEWRLDPAAFPVLEYRVQYGESDFAFLARLCEEAGISFFFEPRDGRGSVLVLCDDPAAIPVRPGPPLPFEASPNEAAEAEYVTAVSLRRDGAPMRIVLRDVDFRRPGFPLYGEAELDEPTPSARLARRHYVPGAFRVHTMHPPSPGAPMPPTKGAGRHDPRAGQELAARLVLSETAQARVASFETNALDLAPGVVVAIANHPHPLLDPDRAPLLVTEFSMDAEHDKEWRATCRAVWTEHPYKPPQKTPRPVVQGLQSAVVQGPRDREVFTDEHGRVKVRFFWDSEAKDDEQTSCWIRVSQVWTGAGFGIWTIPRVGQEVLVGFLEGNPDEPIVVGHVPNALTPPPYPLPGNQTRTVLRSRSTPDGDGFNEISFEDRKGDELLYQRAERDRETWVRRDERELVGGSRQRAVGADEHIAIRGDRRERIDGSEHRTIGGDERAEIGGSASYVIDGDVNLVINGRLGVQVAGDVHILAGREVVIEGSDATLRGAGGFARATGGALLAAPFVENAGAAGVGGGSSPMPPSPPVLPASYGVPPPKRIVRLPVLGFGPLSVVQPDEEVICSAICSCKKLADGRAAEGERRQAQACVTQQIRAYDKALNGQSRIKAEVPYDMTRNPPAPIMSRNEPERPTRGSPKGSRIPDVVVLKDGSKPPTQDNLEKVIEIKFPPDKISPEQQTAYKRIAGGVPMETWGPDTCGCDDRQKELEPVRVSAEDAAVAGALAFALLVLLLDDATGVGTADDVLIPVVLRELAKRLAPLLAP